MSSERSMTVSLNGEADTGQGSETASQPGYVPNSMTGKDYFCPACWGDRGVKELLGDIVIKRANGEEVFDGLYCRYCLDVRKQGGEYKATTDGLHEYAVGGPLGYPTD